MDRLRSLLGLVVLLALAYSLCPRDRRGRVAWRTVGWGIALQFALALLILGITPVRDLLFTASEGIVDVVVSAAQEGARLPFGVLLDSEALAAALGDGGIFAVQLLIPVIVFFAALMAVLYQLGIMQRIVAGTAWVMVRTMRTSGAETLSAVGNVVLGMTEAPLLIRPYLNTMTRSELLTMMTGGMATVAGTVFAVYVGLLRDQINGIAGHLVTASLLSAPAALTVAKLMLPETDTPETAGRVDIMEQRPYANLLDALTAGAVEGLRLAATVIAMLIAMIGLIALLNGFLAWPARAANRAAIEQLAAVGVAQPGGGWPDPGDADALRALAEQSQHPEVVVREPLTFQRIAGWLFAPLAFLIGVPLQDVGEVGRLLGIKTVLNEFLAYLDLAGMMAVDGALTPRGRILASYALCGFANFGSVAIMIGGIGGLAPDRRRDLAELGMLSLVGGTLAACLTACVVGVLLP